MIIAVTSKWGYPSTRY